MTQCHSPDLSLLNILHFANTLLNSSWAKYFRICLTRAVTRSTILFLFLDTTFLLMRDKNALAFLAHTFGSYWACSQLNIQIFFMWIPVKPVLPASHINTSPWFQSDEIFLNPGSFFEHINYHLQLCVKGNCGQLAFCVSIHVVDKAITQNLAMERTLDPLGMFLQVEISLWINILCIQLIQHFVNLPNYSVNYSHSAVGKCDIMEQYSWVQILALLLTTCVMLGHGPVI